MRTTLLLIALTLFAGAPAHAQFKCKAADGTVTFQQSACASDQTGDKMRLFVAPSPDADRPEAIRHAIARKEIMIGMTRRELDRVMAAPPSKTNPSLYSSGRHDQLIYEQPGRTLYVYTQNDVVTAVQTMEKSAPPVARSEAPPARQCPSAREIREIEVEQSKFMNRGNFSLQTELARQLADARACSRG